MLHTVILTSRVDTQGFNAERSDPYKHSDYTFSFLHVVIHMFRANIRSLNYARSDPLGQGMYTVL
jgi:hypothetical protein